MYCISIHMNICPHILISLTNYEDSILFISHKIIHHSQGFAFSFNRLCSIVFGKVLDSLIYLIFVHPSISFPDQLRNVIPKASFGSARGSPPSWTFPEKPAKWVTQEALYSVAPNHISWISLTSRSSGSTPRSWTPDYHQGRIATSVLEGAVWSWELLAHCEIWQSDFTTVIQTNVIV